MKCELCGVQEASIVIQEKRPEGTKEYHICLNCARTRGLASINPQAARVLASIITGNPVPGNGGASSIPHDACTSNSTPKAERIPRVPLTESICPSCGTKFIDAKKTASIGCAQCWDTWGVLLYSKKRSKQYRGKTPSHICAKQGLRETLESLEETLKRALAKENYEQAASIRDQIRQINTSGFDT